MRKGASALIIYKRKILMLLRDDIPQIKNPNTWSFIGGNGEGDETFEQTVLREIKEETNLSPKNIEFVGVFEWADGDVDGVFVVRLTNQEVKDLKLGDEGQELGFFTVDQLSDLKLSAAIKKYCDLYRDKFKRVVENGAPLTLTELGLN